MKQRTKEQLSQLYDRLYDRMTDGMGYQAFGYDWTTLRLARPLLYSMMRRVCQLMGKS